MRNNDYRWQVAAIRVLVQPALWLRRNGAPWWVTRCWFAAIWPLCRLIEITV